MVCESLVVVYVILIMLIYSLLIVDTFQEVRSKRERRKEVFFI